MIRCKLNFDAIDQTKLFQGKKGRYLDITLLDRHGDQYGNDFMVVQDLGKDARLAGQKSPILGNGKIYYGQGAAAPAAQPAPKPAAKLNPSEDAEPDF